MNIILRQFVVISFMIFSLPALSQNFVIPASQPWFDTGLDLVQGQSFSITADGSWSPGGQQPQSIGPSGWTSALLSDALSPFMPFGSLIARIGNTTLLIGGHFSGLSPADGHLYLSMNDATNSFGDNTGQMNVSIIVRPYQFLKANPWLRGLLDQPSLFISPQQTRTLVQKAMGGTIVQLSQTDAGETLDIPAPGGSIIHSKAFIEFGFLLQLNGVQNINIDLPKNEYDWDQLFGFTTGGTFDFGQYFVSHSFLIVDKLRFHLNNIHSNFDTDLDVELGNNEIQLIMQLHAPDPAIRGEGEGYVPLFGFIPIPTGWDDALCPDIALNSMQVTIHLSPFIDDMHAIHLQDPVVEVQGDLTLSLGDALATDIKTRTLNTFQSTLTAELRKDAIRKALENTISNLFMAASGKSNTQISSIQIDHTGMLITWDK